MDNKQKVIITEKLDNGILYKLFNEDTCAIHIKNYISRDLCTLLSKNLLNDVNIEPHPHEIRQNDEVIYVDYGVDRIGVSYHTTYQKNRDSAEFKYYYSSAATYMKRLRESCYPYQYPMDKFRLDMDENWYHKVNLGAFDGIKMFCGIVRIMNAEKSAMVEYQPHFDSLPERVDKLKAQYSVNIYVLVPEQKGELELWDVPAISNTETNKDWRSILPKSFLIKPDPGDLIIFNTRKPHAIKSFDFGKRISIQSFVGLHENNDISIWT